MATGTLEGGYRPEQDVRRAEVTALASHPAGILLAVGHHARATLPGQWGSPAFANDTDTGNVSDP